MHGLMQSAPLTLDRILDHAGEWHGDVEIVSRVPDGGLARTTYRGSNASARRLSSVLSGLGVRRGDRVATLAWNSARHLELWYAIFGIGAVCHTLNPRLFIDQLAYIVTHAGDRILFADPGLAPIVESLVARCPSIEHVVVLGDTVDVEPSPRRGLLSVSSSSELAARVRPDEVVEWGGFSEETAAGLCYTSGTTGNPKGVLYSHRSNYLHTLITIQPDMLGLSSRDVVMPIVPMFHANAWGLALSCPAVGAKMVMPGSQLDPRSLFELIVGEGVTFSAAVPTVWLAFADYLEQAGLRTPTLARVLVGGASCSRALIERLAALDIAAYQGWGMTENSPIGTVSTPTAAVARMPEPERMRQIAKQGHPPLGIDLRILGEDGQRLPHDGVAVGRLAIRGGTTAAAYFGDDAEILDDEGFFDTGDVATIDDHGYVDITDRAKDIIKSGGEWISSIEIEDIAAGHPKAAQTCVVAMPHPKWGERPLLLVRLRPGETASGADFLEFLSSRIARWWMPDEVRFVDGFPLGATGKIDKRRIREDLASFRSEHPDRVA